MRRVLLGLGSNKGYNGFTPLQLLQKACNELTKILDSPRFSSVYKTRAMYVEDQDDFYNMTACGFVDDNLSPQELLKQINNIEAEYGRDRSNEIRFGPRPLDIDIELFGDETINTPELEIPHPRIAERAFVLVPALEILTDSADVTIRERFTAYLKNLNLENGSGIIEQVAVMSDTFELTEKPAEAVAVKEKHAYRAGEFEGPLDLLWSLIRESKVNIYDIPIAQITEQYLEYLDYAVQTDLGDLSEFYSWAAKLIYIKSRMLLPVEFNMDDEDEEDPRQ